MSWLPRHWHGLRRRLNEHPDADMVFSDEDQLDERGRVVSPFFKPGWDPELMLSQNLVGHLAAYRLGRWSWRLAASGKISMAARITIWRCGYRRRFRGRTFVMFRVCFIIGGSRGVVSRRRTPSAARRRHGVRCRSTSAGAHALFLIRRFRSGTRWILRLASRVRAFLSLRRMHLPWCGPVQLGASRSWTRRRMRQARLLVFAGPLAGAETGWLEVLAANARRREVGCVGGRIDDRRGRVVNAGFVLDPDRVAIAERCFADAGDPGYRGRFVLTRSVSAVSLQCLAVRRELFEEVGGLDGAAGVYADVDLCLRLSALGYRCLWTPQARVRTSRVVVRSDADGAAFMRKRWGALLARDPFLNPNLTIVRGRLGLARQTRSNAS